MTLILSSSGVRNGERLPARLTCEGQNSSPALTWEGVPTSTSSFALICEDPDAPCGIWVHWVVYNLPAATRALPAAMPQTRLVDLGGFQGINDSHHFGYDGPCPPPGKPHRYIFTVYALDTMLELSGEVTRSVLLDAMEGHVLAKGRLTGLYSR